MKTVDIHQVNPSYGIIGYYVSDSIGLAILTKSGTRWGFQYLFRRSPHLDLKFEGAHSIASIKSALNAGRIVFLCNTWDEAMRYALRCNGHPDPQALTLQDLRGS